MFRLGTTENPLRVAVIGAGPSGFYVAEHLLKQQVPIAEVDMIERLPTPYGLVRGGVAPDHQKIKAVTHAYDRIAANSRFRYYGNVEFGAHVKLEGLQKFYHQIVFTTGAQTDRRMGIPGEDLAGSYPATEFVAWYNGHPDFQHLTFDLSQSRVAVIGVGNVAVDVARILSRTYDELRQTDIADYALDALRESQVREVVMIGRRGAAQAAFSNPELKELSELSGSDLIIPADEVALDGPTQTWLADNPDRATARKVQMLQEFADRSPAGKARKLILRFLLSPVEICADDKHRVSRLRLVRNELYATAAGVLRPRATDVFEEMSVGMVFRSVGYQGVPLPDIPFDDNWGVIRNERGRVLEPSTNQHLTGLYASGWIKRGPTGVIGTNKPDALETVKSMLEDVARGQFFHPIKPAYKDAREYIKQQQPDVISYEDWLHLNEIEVGRGKPVNRPRIKFTSVNEMLAALQDVPAHVSTHEAAGSEAVSIEP